MNVEARMTNPVSAGSARVPDLSSFVIWSFVIALACVSWARILGAENGEIDDSDNTKAEQKYVRLQISHLDQPQQRAKSPRSTAAAIDCDGINDPSIKES